MRPIRPERLLPLLLFLGGAALPPAEAQLPSYTVTPFGSGTEPSAINSAGWVVGSHPDPITTSQHAFVWVPDRPNATTGTLKDLGTLPGDIRSMARAINDLDMVLVSSLGPDGTEHPALFRLAADGSVLSREPITDYFPTGINNEGQICGDLRLPSGDVRAALDGTPLPSLGGQLGRYYDLADAINDSGTVVGQSTRFSTTRSGFSEDSAVVAWQGGGVRNLNIPDGQPQDINEQGQVVGSAGLGKDNIRAFIADSSGLHVLDPPSGFAGGRFSRINNLGQAIGSANAGSGDFNPFLWLPDKPNGTTGTWYALSGYTSFASSINDAGQIVGTGGFGTDSGVLLTPPAACDQPAIPAPPLMALTTPHWSMQVEVSPNDGLVVRDLRFRARAVASEISVPYLLLKTTAFPRQRAELKPAGDDPAARSRLVGFQVTDDPGHLTVRALYLVDRIPSGSGSCLQVTQRDEFYDVIPGDACEPSMTLPCARMKPIVEYRFFGKGGDSLTAVSFPERLQVEMDDVSPNHAAIFRDLEMPPPLTASLNGQNPLLEEAFAVAIQNGQAGDWDNFHQTALPMVQEPSFTPGCPECFHVHWRWAAFLSSPPPIGGGLAFGNGHPLIPPGSNQFVDIALVRANPGEEDPSDFHTLVNGEPLTMGEPVFWYDGTGFQDSDAFFTHGAFVVPPAQDVTANVRISPGGFRYENATGQFVQAVTVTNTGATPIPTPLALALDNLPPDVTLANSATFTVANAPKGSPVAPIVVLTTPQKPGLLPSALDPGQQALTILSFSDPGQAGIRYGARVLAGPGVP